MIICILSIFFSKEYFNQFSAISNDAYFLFPSPPDKKNVLSVKV